MDVLGKEEVYTIEDIYALPDEERAELIDGKVIHTVGPIYSGSPSDERMLSNCYRNALELARKHDIHSIAFPAISTGVYGYPLQEAVPIALNTVMKWLEANEDYDITVIMSCFDKNTYDMYQSFIDSI